MPGLPPKTVHTEIPLMKRASDALSRFGSGPGSPDLAPASCRSVVWRRWWSRTHPHARRRAGAVAGWTGDEPESEVGSAASCRQPHGDHHQRPTGNKDDHAGDEEDALPDPPVVEQ